MVNPGLSIDMLDAIKQQINSRQPSLYYLIGDGLEHIYRMHAPGRNPLDCVWVIPPEEIETIQDLAAAHAVQMISMTDYVPTEAEQARAMQILADSLRNLSNEEDHV